MNLMGFCLSRWKLNIKNNQTHLRTTSLLSQRKIVTIKPRLTLPTSQPKAFSCLKWGRAFFVPPLQPIFLPLNCETSWDDKLSVSPSP
ncbi:unnamed protein product [Fusarium graminearum]|uniref:Uncharacterized protein n=1 Tax=Gibberella zeae TaxID=5518 RepID=A0A9N8RQ65_GIBZA|nr:unnamed protein product [Fusarium graminearum]